MNQGNEQDIYKCLHPGITKQQFGMKETLSALKGVFLKVILENKPQKTSKQNVHEFK